MGGKNTGRRFALRGRPPPGTMAEEDRPCETRDRRLTGKARAGRGYNRSMGTAESSPARSPGRTRLPSNLPPDGLRPDAQPFLPAAVISGAVLRINVLGWWLSGVGVSVGIMWLGPARRMGGQVKCAALIGDRPGWRRGRG
jgi:hypothetical protein